MLMPLSFATLLGGVCSLTGTPANLVVNDWLINETGGGFDYFATGTVGVPVAAIGIAWMVLAAPWIFRKMQATSSLEPDFGPAEFISEVVVSASSPFAGRSLDEIEQRAGIHVHGVVRADKHIFARRADIVLAGGDILTVEGEMERLDALRSEGIFEAIGGLRGNADRVDVVVMPDSTILGSRVGSLESFVARGVVVIGVASRRRRIEGRYEDLQLGLGDVLMLAGEREAIRAIAADAGVLPLSFRAPSRSHPAALRSLLFFVLGVAATAFGLAPPEIAFGTVVIAMLLSGGLRLREAFQDLNWPIIILLASMIPLGMAVEDTGAAQVIANHIVTRLPTTEPVLVTAVVLLLAAAITPFVDNVSTAAVLSPIAANIATRAGVPIEPLLIAVAVGASLDFLTPFGHHNNAIVMGAAGYRFMDFPRLGLPLLGICLITAIFLLWRLWI
jgi:di/tricarboxylate transporter